NFTHVKPHRFVISAGSAAIIPPEAEDVSYDRVTEKKPARPERCHESFVLIRLPYRLTRLI
ncbi:hypothetical protein QIG54_29350, partial [Klebsiella pneumoniae]|nr:hypothetical protein [Klebsiella pneumoniae]